MFRPLLLGVASLCWLTGGLLSPVAADPPDGYRLTFADEFDQPALDRAKWNTTMAFPGRQGARYHNLSYLHYVLDEDVLPGASTLRLRADRRAVAGEEPPGQYDFSAGLITSADKFCFTYGYIEIRARYPGGPGVWPAFWLMPQAETWPPEFDIAEYYGGRRVMHYGLCHGTLQEVLWDSTGDRDSHPEEEWHTYALDWRPGQAIWLVDGVVKKEVRAAYVPTVPMYIILSNGVSSTRGPSGAPGPETIFPNFLEIDYVRVYQAPAPSAPREPPPILAAAPVP